MLERLTDILLEMPKKSKESSLIRQVIEMRVEGLREWYLRSNISVHLKHIIRIVSLSIGLELSFTATESMSGINGLDDILAEIFGDLYKFLKATPERGPISRLRQAIKDNGSWENELPSYCPTAREEFTALLRLAEEQLEPEKPSAEVSLSSLTWRRLIPLIYIQVSGRSSGRGHKQKYRKRSEAS